MSQYPEFIDPYDKASANVFVRAEHLARYLYAAEYMRRNRLTTVLDAACGDGYGCRVLAASAEAVTGVDRNAALIRHGILMNEELSIHNIDYYSSDLDEGLRFLADSSFDCATCFETLEHVKGDEKLLTEFNRVLRKDGRLLLCVPKAGYEKTDGEGRPENPYHLRLYRPEELKAMLERNGFSVEKALGQPYTNISRVYMEDYCRDRRIPAEQAGAFFLDSQEATEFYARLWGWPVAEAQEKSNVIFLVCRKKR